jgi:hypothetical protein
MVAANDFDCFTHTATIILRVHELARISRAVLYSGLLMHPYFIRLLKAEQLPVLCKNTHPLSFLHFPMLSPFEKEAFFEACQ